MMLIKLFPLAILIFHLFISIKFLFNEFISNYFVRLNLNNLELPDKNFRVLLFSPHCDDEVLSSGVLLKNTIETGGKVKIVLITNGDGFKEALTFNYLNFHPKPNDYIKFGYIRQKETSNALKTLGLSESDIIFLGYPDGGISSLWRDNWYNYNPYTSIYTKTNNSPYINSYSKSAIYSGESLIEDIIKIIHEFNPTHIIFPHPNDKHSDHWSTNAFVKYALTLIEYEPKEELLYLIHRGDWPTPMKENTKMFLVPPAKLINSGTSWHAFPLNKIDINNKIASIHLYETQFKLIGLFLSSFVRKNELFGKYDDIPLPCFNRKDEDIYPSIFNKIINDPTEDTIKLKFNGRSDIAALYMEASENNNLHIFIETRKNISKAIQYNINIITFGIRKTSRLNLEIFKNEAFFKLNSKDYINNTSNIKFYFSKKLLYIIIPKDYLNDYNKLFINAETSNQNNILDKTAWRMLYIKT